MPTDELKLPVELWLLVFSFGKFSSNDLAVLCRVCAGLYHAVVDSLYESITVDNSDVCTTLAECPHLAEKVKSFVFTYPTIMVYDGPEVNIDNLTSALKNMTCLSTLKLIQIPFPKAWILVRPSVLQDSIRDLALTGMPTHDIYPESEEMFLPTSLPLLTEISANFCFLKALVPGRPVHTVRFKGQHVHDSGTRLSDFIDPSTVPVKNLGLDFMIWLLAEICCTPLSKDIEEITLTGLVTQRLIGRFGIPLWRQYFNRMIADARNLKRLTFWFEGKCEDTRPWAEFLFLEFYDTLSRLEHVSCVVAGPHISRTFDFSSGYLPISHEDHRTRGHRAANDVRELMPVPVLCCRSEENLCDVNCEFNVTFV
ncbi:hypothetical protein C8R48DRAFT_829980 [Suillus tomentosus]|nr:hypothetical protein C8R48DRAFT_829980 [Suillus tomentosus]